MGLWGKKTPPSDRPKWNQEDYHNEFAGKLAEQIKNGTAPWQKPWKPGERRLPENLHTGKAYRGGNSVYLSVTQEAKGYSDNRWATYKQIKELDGQVRKGEKATHVLFYKFDDEKEKTPAGAPDPPASAPEGKAERESTRPPLVRCYAVFNVEQADGLTLDRRDDENVSATGVRPTARPGTKLLSTRAAPLSSTRTTASHGLPVNRRPTIGLAGFGTASSP